MNYLLERHSIEKLKRLASQCDTARKGKPLPALLFLQMAEIIPYGIEWKKGNSIPKTRLSPDGIQGQYIAEVAYDWDRDGPTTATEFVNALVFEVEGTEENQAVTEVTDSLGR